MRRRARARRRPRRSRASPMHDRRRSRSRARRPPFRSRARAPLHARFVRPCVAIIVFSTAIIDCAVHGGPDTVYLNGTEHPTRHVRPMSTHEPPPPPVKGRGATFNPENRFRHDRRESTDDGWPQMPDEEDDAPPPLKTIVTIQRARSIVSHNDSPDIPFTQSINPYQGCEHGCIYCYARPTHAYL